MRASSSDSRPVVQSSRATTSPPTRLAPWSSNAHDLAQGRPDINRNSVKNDTQRPVTACRSRQNTRPPRRTRGYTVPAALALRGHQRKSPVRIKTMAHDAAVSTSRETARAHASSSPWRQKMRRIRRWSAHHLQNGGRPWMHVDAIELRTLPTNTRTDESSAMGVRSC